MYVPSLILTSTSRDVGGVVRALVPICAILNTRPEPLRSAVPPTMTAEDMVDFAKKESEISF